MYYPFLVAFFWANVQARSYDEPTIFSRDLESQLIYARGSVAYDQAETSKSWRRSLGTGKLDAPLSSSSAAPIILRRQSHSYFDLQNIKRRSLTSLHERRNYQDQSIHLFPRGRSPSPPKSRTPAEEAQSTIKAGSVKDRIRMFDAHAGGPQGRSSRPTFPRGKRLQTIQENPSLSTGPPSPRKTPPRERPGFREKSPPSTPTKKMHPMLESDLIGRPKDSPAGKPGSPVGKLPQGESGMIPPSTPESKSHSMHESDLAGRPRASTPITPPSPVGGTSSSSVPHTPEKQMMGGQVRPKETPGHLPSSPIPDIASTPPHTPQKQMMGSSSGKGDVAIRPKDTPGYIPSSPIPDIGSTPGGTPEKPIARGEVSSPEGKPSQQ